MLGNGVLSIDWISMWAWLLAVPLGLVALPALGSCGCRLFNLHPKHFVTRRTGRCERRLPTQTEEYLCYWLYGCLFTALLSVPVLVGYCVLADLLRVLLSRGLACSRIPLSQPAHVQT